MLFFSPYLTFNFFASRSAITAIIMTECKEDCHRSINFPSKYAQKVEWPAVVWVTGDSEEGLEYSELSKLIVDCVQLNYTDFIFGKKNIDDDKIWNEYKNKLNDIGVSRYIELVNKYKNA